jgi:acetyltransferase-like isoleucine patch superfamily enzyme
MTLTAPGCPVAGEMPGWVADAINAVPGVKQVDVDLTWEPPWGMDMMSDEARLELGFMFRLGSDVFLNYGCVVLDVCPVTIGDKTQIGPMVQILAADHPRDAASRDAGLENGRPVTIGRNVWIGGGALILPGVTVGDDAIIGAGAVVTRDVAPGATVAGTPARPLAH